MNILTRISRFDKKRSHSCLMLKVVSFEREVCFLRQARPFKLSDRSRSFDFHWLLAVAGNLVLNDYSERSGTSYLRKRGDAQRSVCVYKISDRFLNHTFLFLYHKNSCFSFAFNKPISLCKKHLFCF